MNTYPRSLLAGSLFQAFRPLVVALCTGLASVSASAQVITPATNVRIAATNEVVRPADDSLLLGWNVAWQKFQINFWNTTTQTADANVRAFLTSQLPGALYRYPGGTIGSYFDWKETVGPIAGRTAQFTDNQGNVFPYFGVDEFLRLVHELGGQALLAVPLRFDGHPSVPLTAAQIPEWAQKAADLVEYCNAPNDGSNPGGGTDWAAVRAANGHPEPYHVKLWELDNETDHGANPLDAATYAARCAQFIAAMRAIDPDISIMAHARTTLEQAANWETWHETVITSLAGQIDLIVAHPYYDGIQVPIKLGALSTIRSDALALAPAVAPTIATTEHATWTDIDNANFNARNSSIIGAIGTSDFILGSAQREGFSLATMHVLDGSGWWLAFSQPGATWDPRPVSQSLALMHAIVRNREVLRTTIATPNNGNYNGGYDVRGIVTRKPGTSEYAVGFVNRHATAYDAEIALAGLGEQPLTVTLSTLSDPTQNTGQYANLAVQTSTLTVTPTRTGDEGVFTITLPAKSVGTLTFDAGNLPPQVALTSPAPNATFVVGESVPLAATATDPDGVLLVEFYHTETNFIADTTTAPYVANWTPTTTGNYALSATAHDAGNPSASVSSSAVPITVEPNLVPLITTTDLPDPVRDANYSRTLTASAGNGPLTFTLRAGALPDGLALSPDGVISGNPTKLGKKHFVVGVADSDGNTGSSDEHLQTLSLHVRMFQWGDPVPEEGSEGTTLRVDAGAALSYVDTNGHIWTSDSGFIGGQKQHRLPVNIANTDDDKLYRTERAGSTGYSAPAENGRYTLSLHFAENDKRYDQPGQRVFSISVEGTTPGELQQIDVAATAGYRTALVKSVPIEINDGTLNLAFNASQGPTLINAISLVPIPNSIPAITTTELPSGGVDVAYTTALQATGGDDALAWTLDSGALPAGLTLSSSGILSGTPTEAGSFPLTIRVADSDHRTGEADEDVQAFVLTIRPTTLRIEAGSSASYTDSSGQLWSPDFGFTGGGGTVDRGSVAIAYTDDDKIYQTERYAAADFSAEVANGDYMLSIHLAETFTSIDTIGERVFSIAVEGNVPSSLENIDIFAAVGLNAAHVISVPVTITDHTLDLSFITGAQSPLINGIELVRFVDTVPTVATTTLPDGVATLPYSQQLKAANSNGAAKWALESGALPAGLTLRSNGAITGIPTNSGTYAFTVRVADSDVVTGSADESTAEFTLTIATAPTLLTFQSVRGQDGRVIESGEDTDVGGSFIVANNNSNADLRVGDDNGRKQTKVIISFDTSALPDNAIIVSATLKVVRGVQSFAVNTFGPMYADVNTGGFNGNTALEAADFEAAATAAQAAVMSYPAANNVAAVGELDAVGRAAVNRSGTTQFRLHFLVGDNNDGNNNYLGFWNGGATNTANRPTLEVTYYLQ